MERILLAARDLLNPAAENTPTLRTTYEIAVERAAKNGCDTILFAVSPREEDAPLPRPAAPIETIIGGARKSDGGYVMGVRTQDDMRELPFSPASRELSLPLELLDAKRVEDALVLSGDELNLVRMIREGGGYGPFAPPAGLLDWIAEQGIRLVLNPLMSYVRRWEIKPKRLFLSQNGLTTIAVWNRTTRGESHRQWTLHTGGIELTSSVDSTAADRQGVVTAIIDLRAATEAATRTF